MSVPMSNHQGLEAASFTAMRLAMAFGHCLLASALSMIASTALAQSLCDAPRSVDKPQQVLSAAVCDTIQRSAQAKTLLHGVVLEYQGQLLAERYFEGRDKGGGQWLGQDTAFGPTTLHDMRSISKSVVSLLIGIAQEQGKIGSLDTPVLNYFPMTERPKQPAPGWEAISLRHVLTMSSGLEWQEDGLMGHQTRTEYSGDQERYVLERSIARPPGERFQYVSGNTVLLGLVLERVTGMDLESYARQVLFGPLGIDHLEWRKGRDGRALAHAGLRLSPRDLLKIGALVLDKGRWQGRQIVPQAWIQESTASHLPVGKGVGYGYQWWTGAAEVDGRSWRWVAGYGNGGQRLYVVPELGLNVVIVAGRYGAVGAANGRPSQELFQQILEQVVRSASPSACHQRADKESSSAPVCQP